MGACYSKQPPLGSSSKSKAPKVKTNSVRRKEKENTPDENNKTEPEENSKLLTKEVKSLPERRNSEDVLVVSDSLFLEVESGHADRTNKIKDCGVAPSDSGIESIGTIPDDTQEVSLPYEGRSNLSKRLERLSRGSCHKCGNFKLDDTAITALFSNTYCLCGPRQAGRSSINPKCQTHGARNMKKDDVSHNNGTGISIDKVFATTDSSLDIHDQTKVSTNFDSNMSKDVNGDSEVLAPLAHFDSVDFNLNDSPTFKSSSKRRSLLSEILDLTDSICKCDFYSNEYCCVIDTHSKKECNHSKVKAVATTSTAGTGNNSHAFPSDNGLTDVSFESQASDVTITKSDNEERVDPSDSYLSKSNLSSPKKIVGLIKNVSFAGENAVEENVEKLCVQSSYLSPRVLNYKCFKDGENHMTTSEASSGIYTHSGSVSETHLSPIQDSPKRTLSLGSQGALSSSSSEALDNRTEDDLTSLDLDSLSRVTSLSYGSIRQLVESTEDLVQPLEDVRKVVIDGEDYVAIPADTYLQLQSDLSSLRQQLLYLSTLMQEVCDRRDTDQQALSASFGI